MSSHGLTPETGLPAPRQSLINPPQTIASTSFTDHMGNRAISAYYGDSPHPGAPILPPQWSFHYYVTFGATAETISTLPEDLVKATRAPVFDAYPIRLDVYFLPGASTEACMSHYRGEKATRTSESPPKNFIDPYHSPYSQCNVLVQIDSADWQTTGATYVIFDATSQDDDDDEPPSTYIHRNVAWDDQSGNSLGNRLHRMAGGGGQNDMNDAYYERLSDGHSDWA